MLNEATKLASKPMITITTSSSSKVNPRWSDLNITRGWVRLTLDIFGTFGMIRSDSTDSI